MSFAETLLGITMEQKGVSRVVAVNLEKQGTGEGCPFAFICGLSFFNLKDFPLDADNDFGQWCGYA
jgi:hypothetical protein